MGLCIHISLFNYLLIFPSSLCLVVLQLDAQTLLTFMLFLHNLLHITFGAKFVRNRVVWIYSSSDNNNSCKVSYILYLVGILSFWMIYCAPNIMSGIDHPISNLTPTHPHRHISPPTYKLQYCQANYFSRLTFILHPHWWLSLFIFPPFNVTILHTKKA